MDTQINNTIAPIESDINLPILDNSDLTSAESESSVENIKSSRRRFLRYQPQAETFGKIDLNPNRKQNEFYPTLRGEVFQEAHKGCGLVLENLPIIAVGDHCRIKVGELPITKAELRWKKTIDEDWMLAGFEYID